MGDRAVDHDSPGRWPDEWSDGLGYHNIEAGIIGSGPGLLQVGTIGTLVHLAAQEMREKAGKSTTTEKAGEIPVAAERGQRRRDPGHVQSGGTVIARLVSC